MDALKVLLKKVVVNEDEEGQPSVSWGESDASRRAYASMTSQSVREEHAGVKDATATNRNLLQRLLAGAVVVPDEPKPEENETSVEETGDNDGGSNEAKEAANEPAEGNEEAAPAGEVEDCREAMPEVGHEEKVNVRENMGLEEACECSGATLTLRLFIPNLHSQSKVSLPPSDCPLKLFFKKCESSSHYFFNDKNVNDDKINK